MAKRKIITLPKTAAQADRLCRVTMAEATEKEWALAALVFAQVLPHGKRKEYLSELTDSPRQTVVQFAERGIRGLTSKNTVQAYRDTWQAAVDAELAAGDIRLGDDVELPDAEWGDYYPGDPRDGTAERHVSKDQVAVTPEKVRDAIKSDPKAENAAWEAIQENQAAKRERFRKEREAAGVPRDVIDSDKSTEPAWKDSAMDKAMGYAVEEVDRRERIRDILDLSKQIHDKVTELKEGFGYTGVADEVEWIQEASHHLTETQWALTGFMVEQSESEERS